MRDLTWRCHICHRERPDDRIPVWTHDRIKPIGGGAFLQFREHVRYCRDDPTCQEGAMAFHFVPLGKEERA